MGLISLLRENPLAFFILVPVLLYSVILHEIAHGWTASLFGDDTAKRMGRLSLNPVSHIDPVGALALFFVGFGWAKPVPVNYFYLRSSRIAIVAVSLAGCLTNIFLAAVMIFLVQLRFVQTVPYLPSVLFLAAQINIILGAFNLIPIPPLDGSRVLMEFLPKDLRPYLMKIEPFGFFIIVALLFTGVLRPVIIAIQNFILSMIGVLLKMIM